MIALQVLERVVDSDTGEITGWSLDDETALSEYEARIAAGLAEMWRGLKQVHDQRLYRKVGSFEDYLTQRWGISRSRGYQLIQAAQVVEQVADSGVTIPNERVARAIADVDPDRRLAVVLAAQSASGGKLTSGFIKSADKVVQDIQTTGHVDVGDGEMRAVDAAINLEEYERLHRQQAYNTAAAEKANGVSNCVKIAFKGAQVKYVGQGTIALTVTQDVADAMTVGMVISGALYIEAKP